MPFYRAYGLNICSELPLPELSTADTCESDIQIRTNKIAVLAAQATTKSAWRQGESIYLCWPDLGTFRVWQGKEIAVDPAPGTETDRLRPPILGVCMAVLLHQRGLLVLHASASVISDSEMPDRSDRAIAFLGDKGWGKSTTNAAFRKRGHAFLTDDILAIDLKSSSPKVYPAFGQIKLWPSAVSALGEDPYALPKLLPPFEKRQQLFKLESNQTAVSLKALYVLGKGSALSISPLPHREILGQLFQHSYSGRCGKALLQHGESAHFLQCMALAQQTPVYRLQRPSDLSLLDAIAQAVESHARSLD